MNTPQTRPVDLWAIEKAVRAIIEAIGENPDRPGLAQTPQRIARLYAEMFSGLQEDPLAVLSPTFPEAHEEMVILRHIPFYSMCEHHFLPFFGHAHVGYVPRGRVVGASKLARVVDVLARRPQLQERLTSQVADAIMEALKPHGVAVVIEAEHLCMAMRGIKRPGSVLVTSAVRGVFRQRGITRSEFLALVKGNRTQ